MNETARRDVLAAECGVFCRYLLGREPLPDVIAAYQRAHEVGSVGTTESAALDRALLRVARVGPALARTADAYAAVFARPGLLRRKLVLLLAILESHGPTAALLDSTVSGSRALRVVRLGSRCVTWAIHVALAALLTTPLWIWYWLVDLSGQRGRSGRRST